MAEAVCEIHVPLQKAKQNSAEECIGAADLVGIADNGAKTDDFAELGNVAAWHLDPAKPMINFRVYNLSYKTEGMTSFSFSGNGHFQMGFVFDSGPHKDEPACLHGTFEGPVLEVDLPIWVIPALKAVKGGDVPQTHIHTGGCVVGHKSTEPNQVACAPSPPNPDHGAAHLEMTPKQVPPTQKPATVDVVWKLSPLVILC